MERIEIVQYFELFSNCNTDGIEHFLSEKGKDEVFARLSTIENNSLSKVQLNQLLIISGLNGISDGFFSYYWTSSCDKHPYNVKALEDYKTSYCTSQQIISLQQLRWGLRRIYIDALLYFGNITKGFNNLNMKTENELIDFFNAKRFRTDFIMTRGKTLKFEKIPKADRYLISENGLSIYETHPNLRQFLVDNYRHARKIGKKRIMIRDIFGKNFQKSRKKDNENTLLQLEFAAEDILDEYVESEQDILVKYARIAERFANARKKALQNTKYFLSLVNDLDVYIATSMRTKHDFVEMANTCEKIFKNDRIKDLHLRYFDPTISATDGPEDKGLIECLMVKCARVLIYSAGFKESYGKDAEAAMALSSGKPVIFYCMDSDRATFYRNIHPLTKLIDFSTGVANGAMVTFQVSEVVELLKRIFTNEMQYDLLQPKKGFFKLIEKSTGSAVRIQTNNELLSKSFWNYFDRFVKT